MPRTRLHLTDDVFTKLLEPVFTGRQMHPEDYVRNRHLGSSKTPELQGYDAFMGDTYRLREELNLTLRIGVVTYVDRGQSDEKALRWASKKFSQYFYAPIMPDLETIEDLLDAGQYDQAKDHLRALKAVMCGMSHGL